MIEDPEGDEEEAVEEDSFDLDTIIRELEQEIEEGSYSEEDEGRRRSIMFRRR